MKGKNRRKDNTVAGEEAIQALSIDAIGMTAPESAPDPLGKYGLHALGWLAYKREPEVMQDGKSG